MTDDHTGGGSQSRVYRMRNQFDELGDYLYSHLEFEYAFMFLELPDLEVGQQAKDDDLGVWERVG